MDHGKARNATAPMLHVHQCTSSTRTAGSKTAVTSSAALLPCVETFAKSIKRLNVCQHMNNRFPTEVYASDTSKLTSEVMRHGGRDKRFTKEDGDLSAF